MSNPTEDTASAVRTILADINGNILDANHIKFDADDSAPTYIGINSSQSAATSATSWLIYKFTYSGSNVTDIQKLKGSWDGRAALAWV